MHLIPGFSAYRRSLWKCCRPLSAVLLAASCSHRPQVSGSPIPPPVPQIADSIVPPLVRSHSISADSADYTIHSQIITTESTAFPFVVDTLVIDERVHVNLIPASDRGFRLTLSSDSGYVVTPDRLPPPETISTLRHRYVLYSLSSNDGSLTVHLSDSTQHCIAHSTLVSPLLSAAMTWLVEQIVNGAVRDNPFNYSTCSAGVFRTYELSRQIQHTTNDSLQILLKGNVRTDSSRALPMTIRGDLTGKGTALPPDGSAVLPGRVILTYTVDFSATAGKQHRQQFQQHTQIELTRIY